MAIETISDHSDQAQSRLLSQFQRPNFQALVAAVSSSAQNVEDSLFSILNAFDLATATGPQLDVVARQLGVSRVGLSDDALRVLLYGVVLLNNGNGTAETIVAAARALFQTDQVFFADATAGKHAPQIGRSSIVVGIGSTNLPSDALSLAQSLFARAVGASIDLLFVSSFESGNAFACSGPQAWVRGYASVSAPASGGKFAGLLA